MMNKTMVLTFALLTMAVSLAGVSAGAEYVAIDKSGTNAFLYEGHSYVPLKTTASFLGAPLRWDAQKGQVVMTYKGEDLVLTPNSTKALHAGQPVVLPSSPVIINGVTYVPVATLKKYYDVPVEWDRARSEVRIKGTSGWGTMRTNSRPPWYGGPPPWAPAWGQRGYGTPGHPSSVKPGGNAKAKGSKSAPELRERGASGQRSTGGKANASGKTKANKRDR